MGFLKKYYPFFASFGILLLFLFSRLYNILRLPIFTDEAIYVRWAQIAGTDSAQRFISLTDGKQPSFVWLAAAFMKVISDPLLAARLVSVFAGLGSVIGLYFLGQEIFNHSASFRGRIIGLITSFIYVIFPFALVYDKLALYDSLVAMFIIWSLYFEVLLVRRVRLDLALILGMIMGAGMLTKTSNNFALYLLPFSLLLFNFSDKEWKTNLRKFIVYASVSVILANVIYSVLRLSPYFYIIAQKDATFVYPLREWISHPFIFFTGNMKGLVTWLIGYVTLPFLILAASSFLVEKKYFREKILLLLWFAGPFMALALFGKVIYPRYVLFMSMPLLLLAGYALFHMYERVKKIYLKALVILVFLFSFVVSDYLILTDFAKAPIPQSDKNQLIESWPSGVGVKETVNFIQEKAKTQKVYIGTEGTFGLMPYALEIYLKDNPNVKTQGFWPITDVPPKEVIDSSKKVLTYFVFYQPCPSCKKIGLSPVAWPTTQVLQIPKIEKDSYYTLYQIKPQ